MLTTVGTLTNKAGGASPRKRSENAPTSSLLKESAEKEKCGKSLSRGDIDDDDSDEDDENEGCVDDDDDEDEEENESATRDKAEGEHECEKNDKNIIQQKEIYRAAELGKALDLDIKAQVPSAEEVQSMKSRIEGLKPQVKCLQATIEQNEDQVP
ncbi:hypothetical protein FGB62_78g04 [Gracilaria domingensis]|nr:hypothetical protein FGB62_78g04 [Gracilaria domingensis]